MGDKNTPDSDMDMQMRMFSVDQANRLNPGSSANLVRDANRIYDFISNKPATVAEVPKAVA